jgi:ParB family chromosome partitioning protein
LAALLGTPAEGEAAASGLSDPANQLSAAEVESLAGGAPELLELNVYEIDDNPFQPRREFSEPEIASLSESLKEHDMLQPVLVRRIGDRYQLISGERRLRAAIQAGWSKVPARVREADDRLVAELAIVENLQRKDLNPIEKAMSFRRYLDEHQCAQDDLAQRLKIDRSTIANLMRLLELPDAVLEAISRKDITAGHARALLPLDGEFEQIEFCAKIQSEGLSVRAIEQLVQDHIADCEPAVIEFPSDAARRKRTKSDQIASLEQELRIALGTKVEIRQTNRGRGRLIIHFASSDEFERLKSRFADEDLPLTEIA